MQRYGRNHEQVEVALRKATLGLLKAEPERNGLLQAWCSPASEPRAMLRLLRVSEGTPPVIFRFTETEADTPREVLERARGVIQKAMRGDVEAAAGDKKTGSTSEAGRSPDGKGQGKRSLGGGKSGGSAAVGKKTKWKSRPGVLGTAAGGQSLKLIESMPSGRLRDVHDARQRAALLAGDDVLTAQYKEMVDGGIVTEEEFWESRRRTLAEEEAKATSKRVGTPSDMPSDLVAETTATGTLKFKLNARTIHGIFTMYPIVFKAYQANVPTEMTEKEFWTKYIQSAYFNRDRGGSGDGGAAGGKGAGPGAYANKRRAPGAGGGDMPVDDMFLRLAAEEAEREGAKKESGAGVSGGTSDETGRGSGKLAPGAIDPMVDLTSQWGDHHSREVDDSDPTEERTEAAKKRKQVVGKFNRHARLVMEPVDAAGAGVARRPAVVDTAALATDLPELRNQDAPAPQKLIITNRGRYGGRGATSGGANNGTITAASGGGSTPPRPHSPRVIGSISLAEARASLGHGFSILTGRAPLLERAALGSGEALVALRECTKETDKGIGNAFNISGYPEDFMGNMHRHFQIVGELLRHLYATLERPRRDTAATGKLELLKKRMDSKYQELREARAALPRNATGNRLSAVIQPMMECLDHAFEALRERNSRGVGGVRKGTSAGGWVVPGEEDDEDEEDEDDDEDDDDMRGGWKVMKS